MRSAGPWHRTFTRELRARIRRLTRSMIAEPMREPSLGRPRWLAPVLVAVAAVLVASCSSARVTPTQVVSRPTAPPGPSAQAATPPTDSSVVGARFVHPVELDNGSLLVEPPGPGEQPTLSATDAATEIWASSSLLGYHPVVLGFGIATITVSQAGIPAVTSLPAWVGFADAAAYSCPAEIAPTGPTTTLPRLPTSGYAAVVVGAISGSPSVVYTARASPCDLSPSGPFVSSADEVVSIAWVAPGVVTDGQLAVKAVVPPCGRYEGSNVAGDAESLTVTLDAVVADGAEDCPEAQPVVETVQIGPPRAPGAPPPIVSSRTLIEHGALGTGPIRALIEESTNPNHGPERTS